MAEQTPERINDQLRQEAHAREIAARRADANRTPDERLNALIDARVAAGVEKALANFTIQSGNGIKFSGQGRNITGSVQFPKPPASQTEALLGGEWYELTLCDGTTLEVWATNITPP